MTKRIRLPSRRTLLLLSAGLALLVATGLTLLRTISDNANTADLGTQSATAGSVEVRMTALVLDASGAQFRLALDTHTASLDLDLARAAQLSVDGRLAKAGTWDGAGPGGHHREGTLRFTTAIPAGARVELRLTGLPGEAVGVWNVP